MKKLFAVLAAMLLLVVMACSSGGGGGSTNGSGDTEIPRTTKVLNDTTKNNLSSVSEDGSVMTFSDTTDQLRSLKSGDIIVSGTSDVAPNGFLRKVTSVSKSGDQVIVETTQGTLEDAIKKGTIDVNQSLTSGDVSSTVALRKGVSFGNQSYKSKSTEGFYIDVSDVVLYDRDGNLRTENDQIRADGSISLNPSFNFSMAIDDFKLKQLTFTNTTVATAELELTSGATVEVNKKIEIATYSLNPITVWVGYVPVVIVPVLTVNVGLDGEVSAGITSSVTQQAALTAGLSYNNGDWSTIDDFSNSFDFSPPSLSIGAEVKAYAGPQLNLLLYGVAGPYAEIKGYLELDADVLATPWWELYGGLEADIGVRVEVLGHDITDYERPGVIGYRKLLAQADTPFTPPGKVSGSVKDAVSGLSLGGVSIKVLQQNSVVATGSTNASGTYSLSVPSGSGYRIEFLKTGYISANYYDISVEANITKYLEAVLQIDTAHSGSGNISGYIVNALDGHGVSGLTVSLRTGINVTTGATVASTTTGSGGAYSFSGIAAGNYTAQASGSGYNTTYFSVISIGGTSTSNQNATITPIISSGETRIILTWGETPLDLDSHLTGPLSDGTRFHIYWPNCETRTGSPWPDYVKLDLDDMKSYGPETTTIYQQISGVYRFSVHDYTNRGSSSILALSSSGAQVRVYRGSNLIAVFNVPSNQGGTLWTVFEMNGNTITPINTISYESDSSNVKGGSLRILIHSDASLLLNLPQKR